MASARRRSSDPTVKGSSNESKLFEQPGIFIQSTDNERKKRPRLDFLRNQLKVSKLRSKSLLDRANIVFEIQNEKLEMQLAEFKKQYYFLANNTEKKRSGNVVNCVESILEQYRSLISAVTLLAKKPQNAVNIDCIMGYAKTLRLGRKALAALGKDNNKYVIAFQNHINTLPERHPLSRSTILLGIGFTIAALIGIFFPLLFCLSMLKSIPLISAAGLPSKILIMGAFDIIRLSACEAIGGVFAAAAYVTFFSKGRKAHPKKELDNLCEEMSAVYQTFKTVKGK